MIAALALLVALASPDNTPGAEALRAWDPADLTLESAQQNLDAARTAAAEEGVDPYLLLEIARHESGFRPTTRTPESGGRVSCGVLTPTPRARCQSESLVDQYRAGARHVAEWVRACRGHMRCALLGYAGGYALLRACSRGPMIRVRGQRHVDLCQTDRLYMNRAAELDSDLKNQRAALDDFCALLGFSNVEHFSEIGGGLNFKRKHFFSIVDRIIKGEVSHLVVAHKDRLTRFGFDLLKHLCDAHGCELHVLDQEKLSPEREMVEDLMTIVHCFSARLYGLRNYRKSIKAALK